jgi:hypothetical protein
MKLEVAKENIGAEVELDESTKPYTWVDSDYGKQYIHDNGSNVKRLTGKLKIVRNSGTNIVIRGSNGFEECFSPHHVKFKTENLKINVDNNIDSPIAQILLFFMGYSWSSSGQIVDDYKDEIYCFGESKKMKGKYFENTEKLVFTELNLDDLKNRVRKLSEEAGLGEVNVLINTCGCHPETCCHKDYYITNLVGKRIDFLNIQIAESYMKEINNVIAKKEDTFKPERYKIYVPTEKENVEAQQLFFELGYTWNDGDVKVRFTNFQYLYLYENKIIFGDVIDNFESNKNKHITLQDLREMVAKKKGIKSIGVDLASGEDKKVKGEFQNFESRKEMSWEDAFQALIDGKEVEMLDVHNQWENLKDYYIRFDDIMEKGNKFRIAPKRISLNGEFTEEELLEKIEKLKNM